MYAGVDGAFDGSDVRRRRDELRLFSSRTSDDGGRQVVMVDSLDEITEAWTLYIRLYLYLLPLPL